MAGPVVRKLSQSEGRGLRERLEAAGFEIGTAPYAHYSAKGPGVSVTWYRKGKLLVQGKGADDFAATFLGGPDDEPAPPDDKRDVVDEPIIGTDESGKGDYFGPLVVAAVLVRPEDVAVLHTLGIRDSKSVRDAEALKLGATIEESYGDRVAVVSIPPARYNELHGQFGGNLNRLLAWGHARAMEDVLEKHDCARALADRFGNERLIKNALMERGKHLQLDQRVRAESHPAVAAASIVARARFLRSLDKLGREAGVKLPKGAGSPVDRVARQLYREGGRERLAPVAKLHFRTTDKAAGFE